MNIPNIADINMEALLGRKSEISTCAPRDAYRGKRVLVTGGGGSIGSELCRQIASCEPEKLIIFDISENNSYSLECELLCDYPCLDVQVVIGSVRDCTRVETVFKEYAPNVVFHAAAHKHVPLMEESPGEAVKNNIMGTYNVAACAKRYSESFMLISTDKAVNPKSVMGASKRVCEFIVSMLARDSEAKFGCVRFGNVLGSSGSVIPMFLSQIKRGGPVTVTHKDIIRYFMTVPEAVALVLRATGFADKGEIFVLDMGEPVKIDQLARKIIETCGYKPEEDIEIRYTGLRRGEKLYEELLLMEEGLERTEESLIYKGRPATVDESWLKERLEELNALCDAEPEKIKSALRRTVPEYR